jgi:hypothetical protein
VRSIREDDRKKPRTSDPPLRLAFPVRVSAVSSPPCPGFRPFRRLASLSPHRADQAGYRFSALSFAGRWRNYGARRSSARRFGGLLLEISDSPGAPPMPCTAAVGPSVLCRRTVRSALCPWHHVQLAEPADRELVRRAAPVSRESRTNLTLLVRQ